MAFWITALIIIGVFALLGFIAYAVVANRGYTNKIRIRQKVGNDWRIIDDIAQIWVDPVDKSKKWKLKATKLRLGIPPDNALSLSPKGQLCAECYMFPAGDVQWIIHDSVAKSVSPLETEQRQLIVNEYYKALEKRGKSIWDLIANLAPLIICALIAVFLMVFYEDMGKPLLAMGDKITEFQTAQVEYLEILQDLKSDVQVIGGEKLTQAHLNQTKLTG